MACNDINSIYKIITASDQGIYDTYSNILRGSDCCTNTALYRPLRALEFRVVGLRVGVDSVSRGTLLID